MVCWSRCEPSSSLFAVHSHVASLNAPFSKFRFGKINRAAFAALVSKEKKKKKHLTDKIISPQCRREFFKSLPGAHSCPSRLIHWHKAHHMSPITYITGEKNKVSNRKLQVFVLSLFGGDFSHKSTAPVWFPFAFSKISQLEIPAEAPPSRELKNRAHLPPQLHSALTSRRDTELLLLPPPPTSL